MGNKIDAMMKGSPGRGSSESSAAEGAHTEPTGSVSSPRRLLAEQNRADRIAPPRTRISRITTRGVMDYPEALSSVRE